MTKINSALLNQFHAHGLSINEGVAINANEICAYRHMYNNNYIDKDLMYLADAYLNDDVFNSFFGSSVLAMAKFYMAVYIRFFDTPGFDAMLQSEGIEKYPSITEAGLTILPARIP